VFVGKLSGIAVGCDGFADFLFGNGSLLVEYALFGFFVDTFG
jgi:hypothetical protein